ncbi:Hypothetical protein, putative [Bodo saltans]|uniref:Uncharacterized protein n=1 Tax=Bodo saltans TaxID=75058 RepID=A0A0S4JE85_BODSA|nr:Hypothetical protein, putative [Bodo saltans]|eukprot:CUG88476.1 Hypothetical protein, putative [Bodo saltans]
MKSTSIATHESCLPTLSALALSFTATQLQDDGADLLCQCAPETATLVKKLRVVSLAASRLGHRSCHALWGPSESCKEIVLEAVVSQLRRAENVLVMSFNGDTLQSDDDAVLQAALELKQFLSSPSSMKLRNKNSVFRLRNFPFALMMKLSTDSGASSYFEEGLDEACDDSSAAPSTHSLLRTKRGRDPRDEAAEGPKLFPNLGTTPSFLAAIPPPGATVLTRPGPAALGALQDALVSLTRGGVGIVIAIQNVARFSVWCDRMVYLLSGLMHDAEESGAGMSLLLTSLTPDLRHTEKRLSSRLTSEMWFVAPPYATVPGTLACVLGRTLVRAQEEIQRVALQVRESQQQLKKLSSTTALLASTRRKAASHVVHQNDGAAARSFELETEIISMEHRIEELKDVTSSCTRWCEYLQSLSNHKCNSNNTVTTPTTTTTTGRANGTGKGKQLPLSLLTRFIGGEDVLWNARAGSNNWQDILRVCRSFCEGHSAATARSASPPPAVTNRSAMRHTRNTDTSIHQAETPSMTASQLLVSSGAARADLLERCLLVELGYATREVMLLLMFCWLRSDSQPLAAAGPRTLDELIHDMQSTLPSSMSIKSIANSHFRAALVVLVSLGIVEVENSGKNHHAVTLRRDRMAVKQFLQDVLRPSSSDLWERAGLTLQDKQHLSHLVR